MVFLGGTCTGPNWRKFVMTLLGIKKIPYFNPVVEDWNAEAQAEEVKQRASCDICLYVITPYMEGVYSIAEVIDDCYRRRNRAIFVPLKELSDREFSVGEWKSIQAVAKMVTRIGGSVAYNLQDAVNYSEELIKKGVL